MHENTPALEIRGLAHRFKNHQALAGVNFTVPQRSIHGFVGPNGAGKTTTLKIIATLLPPQFGTVRVFGMDLQVAITDIRRRIGFMPDHFGMYRQMTVFEYLDFFGAAYGLSAKQRTETIDNVLQLTDMEGRRDDLIRNLSRGMQQRVSLARVLVHDPDLLLLDEPASGLDPRARIELMEILRELRKMGKTIFISSHILSELAMLCDSVTIIDRGKVRYTGPVHELLSRGQEEANTFELLLEHANGEEAAALANLPGVQAIQPDDGQPRYLISFDREVTNANALMQAVLATGLPVIGLQRTRRQLDQAFMDLTEPGVRS